MASTHTSRKVSTQTANGKTIKTTVITETKVFPDGREEVNTTTEVEEQGAEGAPSHHVSEKGHSKLTDGSKGTNLGASATGGETPANMRGFIDDVVKAHNAYRKKHGKVGDVKNNLELNKIAQKWANNLAAKDMFQHSQDSYKGDKLGENIAYKQGTGGVDYTGQEVTDNWYNEIEVFDFKQKEANFSKTGHFTQVVWKGSTEIGVGKAHGNNGKVYVVCNYLPAGNVIGHYDENVFQAS